MWELGERNVRAVLDELNARSQKERKYTTVMTTMARLDRKGLLARRRERRTDFYSPTLSRDQYRQARAHAEVDALVEEYGDAALVQFARQMDQLDPDRREQLRRLAHVRRARAIFALQSRMGLAAATVLTLGLTAAGRVSPGTMSLGYPALLAAMALTALPFVGCGSTREPATPPSGRDVPKAGEDVLSAAVPRHIEHVHGLGTSHGTLYIATHEGLWRAPRGRTRALRVDGVRQDIMGFSTAGGGRFIGSGHPAPTQKLAPNLGLIESRDRGRTWRSVSLVGDADFHVLESSGKRIYGFDSSKGRLMISADRGRSWRQRTSPATVFSLAIHPTDPESVIAFTDAGLLASTDGGEGWRTIDDALQGLLAWPTKDRLYRVDGQGRVFVSSDGAAHWKAVGKVDGQPAAFIADGNTLYVALDDGPVLHSGDGGRSWSLRAAR